MKVSSEIKFLYEHEGYSDESFKYPKTKVKYTINGESTISEVCVAFENFLLSCGYRLNRNTAIGIIEK